MVDDRYFISLAYDGKSTILSSKWKDPRQNLVLDGGIVYRFLGGWLGFVVILELASI